MALAFLNLKSFHPLNKANQRKKWIAEQQHKDTLKKEELRIKELEQEQELYKEEQEKDAYVKITRKKTSELQSEVRKRKQLLKQKIVNNDEETKQVEKPKTILPAAVQFDDFVRGSSTDGAEQTKKKRRGGRKRGGGDATANSKSLNFIYQVPPGLKDSLEKEKKQKEKEEREKQDQEERDRLIHQTKAAYGIKQPSIPELMRIQPKISSTEPVPLSAEVLPDAKILQPPEPGEKKYINKDLISDVEKFPMLKHAPTEGNYTENVKVKHKPFGIELRNVKCTKCGEYGHTNIDRECPLFGISRVDADRLNREDPLQQMKNNSMMPEDEDPSEKYHQEEEAMIDYFVRDDGIISEEIYEILATMSSEDKKKLYKKYKKLKSKLKKRKEKFKESHSKKSKH